MNPADILSNLVGQLGRHSGLPGLGLDENSHAAITFNQAVTIHFQARDADILLYASLGGLPEDNPQAAMRRLLRANFLWRDTGGATLSLTPGGETVLAQALPPGDLDFSAFQERFTAFARTAARWKESWQQASSENAAPETAASGEELPSFAIPI